MVHLYNIYLTVNVVASMHKKVPKELEGECVERKGMCEINLKIFLKKLLNIPTVSQL